jgi:hypothetical protein
MRKKIYILLDHQLILILIEDLGVKRMHATCNNFGGINFKKSFQIHKIQCKYNLFDFRYKR